MKIRVKVREKLHKNNNIAKEIVNKDMKIQQRKDVGIDI